MTVQEFCEIKAEITHSEIPIKTQEKLIRILKDAMNSEECNCPDVAAGCRNITGKAGDSH